MITDATIHSGRSKIDSNIVSILYKTAEVGPVIIMGRDVSSMSFPGPLEVSGVLLLAVHLVLAFNPPAV